MWCDSKKMEGGPVIDNQVKLCTLLLGEIYFTTQEAQYLTLGIRLAKTPREVHWGLKGNQLMATTITEAWSRARDVFGELWTKDTLVTDTDSWSDKEDLGSQILLTPTKYFFFKEVKSILKSLNHSRTKESESSKAYYKPRTNVKPTKKR